MKIRKTTQKAFVPPPMSRLRNRSVMTENRTLIHATNRKNQSMAQKMSRSGMCVPIDG